MGCKIPGLCQQQKRDRSGTPNRVGELRAAVQPYTNDTRLVHMLVHSRSEVRDFFMMMMTTMITAITMMTKMMTMISPTFGPDGAERHSSIPRTSE